MAGIQLYDYQKDAVDRMNNGCILCGGVGSGKSITSIAYYYILNGGVLGGKQYIRMKKPMDLYIITTARKRDTYEWENELSPFLLSPNPKVNGYSNKVVIDSWNNIKKYIDAKDSFFIFDEQRVVGSGTWVKSFLKITKRNQWILLSATPGDTWSDYIPVFLANGFYKNRTEFISNHIVYKRFVTYPVIDKYINIGRLMRLRNKILVKMNFERQTQSHHIDIFTAYDIEKYGMVSKKRWNIFEDKPIDNASDYCYVLRKVVNSDPDRSKLVRQIFSEHNRVIVFYNFDYELDILKNTDFGKDVQVAEWNGHKHQPIPESKKWVYLVQYNAGAEGWNCITTDTIIFYSQNYSYKVMVQSSGRIDRLNTPFQNLYYYHLKSKSSIDQAIGQALKKKKKFNEGGFYK